MNRKNVKYSGLCCIKGCGKVEIARNWCYRHYTSNRKYGSPDHIDSADHLQKVRSIRSANAKANPNRYWSGKTRPSTTAETKAKMSASHLARNYCGRGHHRFGKSPAHLKRIEYHDTIFRSDYEVRFAKMLDAMGVRWLYEPCNFDLGECTYTPDFYLPQYQAYCEIKGWMTQAAQAKIDLFMQKRSEPLIVFSRHFFKHQLDRGMLMR